MQSSKQYWHRGEARVFMSYWYRFGYDPYNSWDCHPWGKYGEPR